MTKPKKQEEQEEIESAIYESEVTDPAEDPIEEDVPTDQPIVTKD